MIPRRSSQKPLDTAGERWYNVIMTNDTITHPEPGSRAWNDSILDRIAALTEDQAKAALCFLSGASPTRCEQVVRFAVGDATYRDVEVLR
jgi:hypothetical protein